MICLRSGCSPFDSIPYIVIVLQKSLSRMRDFWGSGDHRQVTPSSSLCTNGYRCHIITSYLRKLCPEVRILGCLRLDTCLIPNYPGPDQLSAFCFGVKPVMLIHACFDLALCIRLRQLSIRTFLSPPTELVSSPRSQTFCRKLP